MSSELSTASDYTICPLGDFFDIVKDRSDAFLPIYSVTLRDGMQRREELGRIIQSDLKSEDNLFAARNDICYNMMRMWQGASGLAPEDCHVSPAYVVCRPKEGLDPRFAAYLLKSEQALKQFIDRSQGVTSDRWRLYPEEFTKIRLPIPPLPEQMKIAEILSLIDRQLDLLRCQESKSRELLSAILNSAFSEPDLSPYSDTSNSLSELEEQGKISLGRGKIISKTDIRDKPGGFPIYSSSGKGDGKFGEYGEYMFDEELITWSIDGGGRLFHRSKHRFSVTNVCGYLRKMDDSIDYKYLHSALEYQHGRIRFDYSHKAHPSVIRELYRVALPPIERQRQIASVTASVKQQNDAIANKVHTLKTFKSAISADLLSGRKRVTL